MATPKPGEIRCPTCHRSTPPAAFCTQCGSAIPADARIRPRGMDRDELQERIRARRSGEEPYRRGGSAGEGASGYERFRPEPEDAAARRVGTAERPRQDLLPEAPAAQPRSADQWAPRGGAERADLTRDRDDWSPRSPAAHDAFPTGARLAPVEDYRADHAPEPDYDEFDEPAYGDQYGHWDADARGRRSAGAGALAILGFLALGVLALLGGAVLAGIFGGDPQVGQVGTTPSPTISAAAATNTPEPTVAPSDSGGAGATSLPRASGEPVVFPDGFTAEVQPCLPGSADEDGCQSNGANNGGSVVIWVGFTEGSEDDVISVAVRQQGASTPEGTATIDLSRLNCGASCDGWTYFPFDGLDPGPYDVNVTRNGDPAGESSFVVS